MSATIIVRNEAETDLFGKLLAETLPGGTVVALLGTLGAGKTRLVQAVASALGASPEDVGSPTFVLIREYDGVRPIYHFDAYRLRDADEFWELGADEYFDSDGISFVEWADRVEEATPRDRLQIVVEPIAETERRLTVAALGEFDPEIETRLRDGWVKIVEKNGV